MNKFIEGLTTAVAFIIAFIIIAVAVVCGVGFFVALPALLAPLVGAFSGAIVGWAFPGAAAGFLAGIGMGSLKLWQLGAMLGFVGRFFRQDKPLVTFPPKVLTLLEKFKAKNASFA